MALKWTDEASLRRLAEEGLIDEAMDRLSDRHSNDALLHELLVHKAELEMQNEALRDAQLEIAALHARYKALFDDAPTAYVVVDDGSRITAANDRAARLLGGTPGALRGVRLTRHLLPEEAVPFERYRRQVTQVPAGLRAEFTMVVAGGAHREIRVDGVVANGDGTGCYLALTDVTDYSQRARQRGEEPARNGQERSGRNLVDLNVVLTELEPVLPALLGEHIGAEVRLGASDGSVRLDRIHIEQILLAAVRNARHAMPHGGTFRIETASIELTERERMPGVAPKRLVKWTLSDTGTGMADSTRTRAFEPVLTNGSPGAETGLGLSMVKAAVEQCGGSVELESELGRGTTLVIHLPCATGTPRR